MIERTVARVACALIVVAACSQAEAQSLRPSELSAGGGTFGFTSGNMLGWYGDAVTWLTGTVGVVGDASGFYSSQAPYGSQQWHALLGGGRLRLLARPKASVFGQFLLGGAGYSQTFNGGSSRRSSWSFAVQPGVGVHVPLDDKWAVRIRTDLRIATGGGEPMGGFSLAAGLTRTFGR